MNRKALFIARVDESDINNKGIIQKIKGQSIAHEKLNWSTDRIANRSQRIFFNNHQIVDKSGTPTFLFALRWYQFITPAVISKKYDLLWIRYGLSTPSFIRFLNDYKQKYPDVTIIIDMPTYPYHKEWRGIKGKVVMYMDRKNRRKLSKLVTLILHSGPERKIFDIQTYYMTNGINHIKKDIVKDKRDHSTIDLLAIGKWQKWHGLDRVIMGMSAEHNMVLHVVGEGPYSSTLRRMVAKRGLEKVVVFYGSLDDDMLTDLYQRCDIGIGTLGIHRKKVRYNSSLKHRHYCLNGLPFIYSGVDSDFPNSLEFIMQVDESEDEISFDRIERFFFQVGQEEKLEQRMQQYASQQLSWNKRIKELHDKIFIS